ncbi:MAG: type II toxin-antitoxin system VapC family toxin [Bacteroidota bacterium]|nr:type II toxin-antitoxin system VapC family toxin [Bacteroidota bacterium]
MDRKIICLDTSILVEYFRKKDKNKSFLIELTFKYKFAISVITKLEILNGSNQEQQTFWDKLFNKLQIIPLGEKEVEEASKIIKKLRSENKIIELADVLIGATAKTHKLKIATLNIKHFKQIDKLEIVERK